VVEYGYKLEKINNKDIVYLAYSKAGRKASTKRLGGRKSLGELAVNTV
jgi:hypothetical protein